MAVSAGKDAVLKVDNVDGTLTDITTYLTSITAPSIDAQVAEVSTLGDAYKSYIRTQVDPGRLSFEGVYEHTIGTILHDLGTAGAGDFEYYPQGTASGSTKVSGSVFLASYEVPADRDDAVLFSGEFQVTGTLTVGTAA